jgi:hypothetical protein
LLGHHIICRDTGHKVQNIPQYIPLVPL